MTDVATAPVRDIIAAKALARELQKIPGVNTPSEVYRDALPDILRAKLDKEGLLTLSPELRGRHVPPKIAARFAQLALTAAGDAGLGDLPMKAAEEGRASTALLIVDPISIGLAISLVIMVATIGYKDGKIIKKPLSDTVLEKLLDAVSAVANAVAAVAKTIGN